MSVPQVQSALDCWVYILVSLCLCGKSLRQMHGCTWCHTTTFTLYMYFAGDASQKVKQNFCRSGRHVLFIYSEICEAYHTCTLEPFLYTSPHILAVHREANADHICILGFQTFYQ